MSWDAVGHQGRGQGIAEIAGIADIARDRKNKILPLIRTDVTGPERAAQAAG
jgi:hypothetical protein